MSSAILYVAIVVIWACVLIPRWLRRDSSSAASTVAAADASDSDSVDSGVEEGPARVPGSEPRRRRQARRLVPDEPVVSDRVVAEPVVAEPVAAEPVVSEAVVSDPGYRRVVAARRRLLIMLLALSVASGVLAGARMAAWWVIVPPSVMLLGYLLLLRAAAKADAERREVARYRMAREAAQPGSASVAHVTPVARVGSAAHVAPAAKIIAFLPPLESAEEEIYDQYTDAKLRAVGD